MKTYPLETVSEHMKIARDAAFKLRFRYYFGQNASLFESIVHYRETWEKSLFTFSEDQLARETPLEPVPPATSLLEISSIVTAPLDPIEVRKHYPKDLKFGLIGDSTSSQSLALAETLDLKPQIGRSAHAIYCGGHVLAAEWLPHPLGSVQPQFLAVSIIYDPAGLAQEAISTDIAYFSGHKPAFQLFSHTAIQIWQYHPETSHIDLFQWLDTLGFGAATSLKWVPGGGGSGADTLGLLLALFAGDGKVHLLKIERDSPNQYSQLMTTSLSYSAQDAAVATTFEVLGHDRLLMGTSDGKVIEYILPTHADALAQTVAQPSSVIRVGDNVVTNILVANVGPLKWLIGANCASADCFMYEYGRAVARHGIPHTRLLLRCSYNPTFKSFLTCPAHDHVSFQYIMCPFDLGNTLLRTDAPILAIRASERLGHPLALISCADGLVHLTNYTRKYLNGGKVKPNFMQILRVWQLVWDDDQKQLLVDSRFSNTLHDLTQSQACLPPQLLVQTVAWNENTAASSMYAVGTAMGLLFLERLDQTK